MKYRNKQQRELMNLDTTLIENLELIDKKRVGQEFEMISKHGNAYRFSLIFNSRGNYGYIIERQNGITGKYHFETSSGYLTSRSHLYQCVESQVFYHYELLYFLIMTHGV